MELVKQQIKYRTFAQRNTLQLHTNALCHVSFAEIFVSPTQELFFSPSQWGPRFLVYHICISKLIFKVAFMKNTKILDKARLEYFLVILPSLSCLNFNQMRVRGVCFVFALYRPVVILLAGLPLLLAEICIFLLSPRLRISQIQFSHLSHFANDTARANIQPLSPFFQFHREAFPYHFCQVAGAGYSGGCITR